MQPFWYSQRKGLLSVVSSSQWDWQSRWPLNEGTAASTPRSLLGRGRQVLSFAGLDLGWEDLILWVSWKAHVSCQLDGSGHYVSTYTVLLYTRQWYVHGRSNSLSSLSQPTAASPGSENDSAQWGRWRTRLPNYITALQTAPHRWSCRHGNVEIHIEWTQDHPLQTKETENYVLWG